MNICYEISANLYVFSWKLTAALDFGATCPDEPQPFTVATVELIVVGSANLLTA